MDNEYLRQDVTLFAEKHYDAETFRHAVRVAMLAEKIAIKEKYNRDLVYIIAIAHDLLEDTDCTIEQLEELFNEQKISSIKTCTTSVIALTKKKNTKIILNV